MMAAPGSARAGSQMMPDTQTAGSGDAPPYGRVIRSCRTRISPEAS